MMALVFEVYGALCLFALVVFLALAAVAKFGPDLDKDEFDPAEFDLTEFVKLKKLLSPVDVLSIEPLIMEEPFWSPPSRQARAERASHEKAPATLPYP
jgi:hypothetical protein